MSGIFAQVGLLVVSVIIVVSYIQPTLTSIGSVQDEIYDFEEALNNATELNRLLSTLVAQVNAVPVANQRALERYMPDTVDSVAVLSDLEVMTLNNQLALLSASGENSEVTLSSRAAADPLADFNPRSSINKSLVAQDFTLSLLGRYENFLAFLNTVENNVYPLDVVSLSFTPPTEGTLYTYSLTLRTYSMSGESNLANE